LEMMIKTYDLMKFLERQRTWSEKTFGPGDRTKGIVAHVRKELEEILEASPEDALDEWIDVIILSLDQCWRLGASPQKIAWALENKYQINMKRRWEDWRTKSPDEPVEHIRDEE
jgi:hypothetical protein